MLFNINKSKSIETSKKIEENNELVEKKIFNHDLNKAFDDCIKYFSNTQAKSFNLFQRKIKSKDEFIDEVKKFFLNKRIIKEDVEELTKKFMQYIEGYYVLEELINDESISDIKVISPKNVRIKRYGKRYSSDVEFADEVDFKRFINTVAMKNRVNLSKINAKQSFTDITSNDKFRLRFNISTELLNTNQLPFLQIRKIPKIKYTKERLMELGLWTKEEMNYLIDKVNNGQVVIFTGKGASGKTTVMNTLLDEISHEKSGLVIQENDELFSYTHPELIFQHVVTNNGEGKVEYQLKDLAINGLLIDLDHFIISEIKGGEAIYFLIAANTGHKVMASGHGNSSKEAMYKIIDYMTWESRYSQKELMKMFKYMDTTICFMKDFKVEEISSISGYDEDKQEFIYKDIFKGSKRIA